jgi:hypothetical protein
MDAMMTAIATPDVTFWWLTVLYGAVADVCGHQGRHGKRADRANRTAIRLLPTPSQSLWGPSLCPRYGLL